MEDCLQLGKWRNIPVMLHWTALLSFVWLFVIFHDLLYTIVGAVFLFAVFATHEFGHVIALRRRKIPIDRAVFTGLHGETTRGSARKEIDEILIARSGVGAQFILFLIALAGFYAIRGTSNALISMISFPIFYVLFEINLFLAIVALLPIGPFDGRVAWRIIPWTRSWLRRHKRQKASPKISAEELADLEEKSKVAAAKIIEELVNRK